MEFPVTLRSAWLILPVIVVGVLRWAPYTPQADLREAVTEHLRVEYTNRHLQELSEAVSRNDEEEVEDVIASHYHVSIVIDSIRARGPLVPAFAGSGTKIYVRYRIQSETETTGPFEQYFEFRRTAITGWRYYRRSSKLFYYLHPL